MSKVRKRKVKSDEVISKQVVGKLFYLYLSRYDLKFKVNRRSKMIMRVIKPAKMAKKNAVGMTICMQLNQIKTRGSAENPRRMVVCSDSKSLIESMSSTKKASEGPMHLNIEHLKDFRDHGEVTEFKWVPTGDMLMDTLTKQRVDTAVLVRVLRSGRLRNPGRD